MQNQWDNQKIVNCIIGIAILLFIIWGIIFIKVGYHIGSQIQEAMQTEEAIVIESDDNLEEIEEETPDTQKVEIVDALEHLFSYLYPNRDEICHLLISKDEYEFRMVLPYDEVSDPYILQYEDSTDDGLYHRFCLKAEIWEIKYGVEEQWKEFEKTEDLNYWYVNTETGEIIPRWTYNQYDSRCIGNEVYTKINREYDKIKTGDDIRTWITFSSGKSIEHCEKGKFRNYEELIEILSNALVEGTIEETLQEMEYMVEPLTDEEIQRIAEKDTYGWLNELIQLSYKEEDDVRWYVIEQSERERDVVLQYVPEDDGYARYETYKCDKYQDGTMRAWGGWYEAYADNEEFLFITYNDWNYLCTPKRDANGKIEGVAVHIYEFNDYNGSSVYIEYTDEICVKDYAIVVAPMGDVGEPIPDYLYEKGEENQYLRSLSSWSGVYNYAETFPHAQAEGLNYFIGYKIYIYEKQGEYFAEVSSNGWQIESKSLAYVTGDETSIDLVFMETMPDDSLYGTCERYEKDDVLLSLSWQNGTLETNWKKLRNEHPAFIEIEDEIVGEYFLKKNDEYTE